MEPRRPRIRATYKQLKLLVKFMGDNPLLARGVDYRTAIGRYYHDSKWTELANLLNAQENGMNKSPRQWNRYWKDLKSGIKKKLRAMKMRPTRRNNVLTGIEQIIFRHICESKNAKKSLAQDILKFTIPNIDKLDDIFEKINDNPCNIEVTSNQQQLLIKFIDENPSLAKPHTTSINRQFNDAKWTEIADILNEQKNSPVKSSQEWKSYWNGLKSNVRKKVLSGNADLSEVEQIIYKGMCENNNTESALSEDRSNNCTPPNALDNEEDDYEVEYLEDFLSEDQSIRETEEAVDDLAASYIDIEEKIHPQDKQQADDCTINNCQWANLNRIPATETEEIPVQISNPNEVQSDINSAINNNSTEVLLDIRNELKALVEVQKDRAKSAQRLAAAQERKAILEEKKVRIEERRLKIEERRVALEEKKFEAAERRSF